MSEHNYKIGATNINVKVSSDSLIYTMGNITKTIPASHITGFGVGILTANQNAANMYSNYRMMQKDSNPDKYLNKNMDPAEFINNMEGSTKTTFVIIAQSSGPSDKVKAIYLPLNLEDGSCIDMLRDMKEKFKSKYLGFGYDVFLKKFLGVSNNLKFFLFAIAGLFLFYILTFLFS